MPRFGIVPPEPAQDKGVASLAPGFARKLAALLDGLRAGGWPHACVGETFRTAARQEWLYGCGRDYDDGRGIVTQADTAATGWHGYGLAADVWFRAGDGYAFAADAPFAAAMREGCAAVGLRYGGDWAHPDLDHVQWAPMKDRPSEAVAQPLYRQGNIAEVWRLVGADT